MNYKKIAKEFEKLGCDEDKWRWIAENQDTKVLVMLDNDNTFAIFDDEEWRESMDNYLQIDEYIGSGPGIGSLLDAFGIRNEPV